MYLFFAVTVMALFAVNPVSAQYQIPHGFVTYSKGNGYDRVLCRVEIAPGMTFEEIHATEQLICEKGKLGGDVEGQISFDGKWLAFARCAGKTDDGSGGNNYGDFGQWDIYVVRIDGPLPAKPIRIDRGYYPSWGDDSYGDPKTLYYAQAETGKVFKVKLSSDGSVSEKEFVAQVPIDRLENFVFMAPNGTFAAYRKHSNVYTYYFEGPLKGKEILLTNGCHPHVTADSKWVYHAKKTGGPERWFCPGRCRSRRKLPLRFVAGHALLHHTDDGRFAEPEYRQYGTSVCLVGGRYPFRDGADREDHR